MSRWFRLFLTVLAVACTALGPLARAQTSIYTPPQYIYPSLMGTDGNLYGVAPDTSSGMWQLNPNTGVYTLVNSSLTSATLCSITANGSILALSQGNTFLEVTLQGVVTTLAKLPYTTSICPVLASDGNYYGGWSDGGSYGYGYLYQLTVAGKVTVLYNFTGAADGFGPTAPLLQGSDGNLYGVNYETSAAENEMFSFSAANGLQTYNSTLGIQPSGVMQPLLEGKDGNFYIVNDNSLISVTPQGTMSSISLPISPPYGTTSSNGRQFLGGDGIFYLEEYYYYTTAGGDCESEYLYLYSVNPANGDLATIFSLGGYDDEDNGNIYSVDEFLSGNGSFYGGSVYEQTIYNGDTCVSGSLSYDVYSVTGGSPAPISFSLTPNRILPGQSTTITWNETNGFSGTLQQCYGYNGLTGTLATSGTKQVTYSQAGTYTPAIVCGGTQTGVAQVFVGDTQLVLSASPSTSVIQGKSVTLSAAIQDPGTPQPSGNVQFLYNGEVLGTSAVNSNGVATFTASTKGLPLGAYAVTAKYLGNSNYSSTTSSPLTVTVKAPDATTTTLDTSTPTVIGGQAAQFSVTVSNGNLIPSPTGTVALYLGSQALLSANLTPGSPSTASLSASAAGVAPGTYSISAKYSGDSYNASSTSSPLTITVTRGVTITVSASPNPVPAGDGFTLTAKLAGNSSAPTGTVIFSAGSQELAGVNLNDGVATADISAGKLAAGTYSVTASYAGDSNNPSGTSVPYSLTVQ